jgi:hypothetical protein
MFAIPGLGRMGVKRHLLQRLPGDPGTLIMVALNILR